MNIQDKIIKIDVEDPKQVYDFELLECKNFMAQTGRKKVFQEYCNFYKIDKDEAKKIERRFRNFWSNRITDHSTLEKYQNMIKQLK